MICGNYHLYLFRYHSTSIWADGTIDFQYLNKLSADYLHKFVATCAVATLNGQRTVDIITSNRVLFIMLKPCLPKASVAFALCEKNSLLKAETKSHNHLSQIKFPELSADKISQLHIFDDHLVQCEKGHFVLKFLACIEEVSSFLAKHF